MDTVRLQRTGALAHDTGHTAAASADIDALARLVGALGLSGNYNEADIARLRATQTLLAGHLEESERFARAAHERFTGVGEPDADKVLAAQLLPVRIEQNRGPELAEAIEACATRSPAVAVWNAALCRLHALAGRTRQARDELRALAANDFAAIPRDADWLGTLVLLADACVELGELRLGESLERRLRPYADRNALIVYGTAVVGTVAGALGRLATSLQRLDDAVVQHEHALAFSEAMKAPGLAGHAAVDLAITLLRRDRPNAGPQAHRLLVRAT